jgi:hypothetical protein
MTYAGLVRKLRSIAEDEVARDPSEIQRLCEEAAAAIEALSERLENFELTISDEEAAEIRRAMEVEAAAPVSIQEAYLRLLNRRASAEKEKKSSD